MLETEENNLRHALNRNGTNKRKQKWKKGEADGIVNDRKRSRRYFDVEKRARYQVLSIFLLFIIYRFHASTCTLYRPLSYYTLRNMHADIWRKIQVNEGAFKCAGVGICEKLGSTRITFEEEEEENWNLLRAHIVWLAWA